MKKSVLFFCLTSLFATSLLADKYEPISETRVTAKGLDIQVISSGCTKKEHFTVHRDHSGPQIAFIRNVPDRCKMVHHPIWIHFNFNELKLHEGEGFTLRDTFLAEADQKLPDQFFCKGEGFRILVAQNGVRVTHKATAHEFTEDQFTIIYNLDAKSVKASQHDSSGNSVYVTLQFHPRTHFEGMFEADFYMKKMSPFVGGTIENDPNMRPATHAEVVCSQQTTGDL